MRLRPPDPMPAVVAFLFLFLCFAFLSGAVGIAFGDVYGFVAFGLSMLVFAALLVACGMWYKQDEGYWD